MSHRNVPLVYQGRSDSSTSRVLTVELAEKWYEIFVVDPKGQVEILSWDFFTEYDSEVSKGSSGWGDHVPNPNFCNWLVNAYPDFVWDETSLDTIYGRWFRESLDCGYKFISWREGLLSLDLRGEES